MTEIYLTIRFTEQVFEKFNYLLYMYKQTLIAYFRDKNIRVASISYINNGENKMINFKTMCCNYT